VDFLDEKSGDLIQVTYDEDGVKERELSSLVKASSLLGFKHKIITWDREEVMDYSGKKIMMEPLWKFLLKSPFMLSINECVFSVYHYVIYISIIY
jgi:predicted AAA+ superfamily ATPase